MAEPAGRRLPVHEDSDASGHPVAKAFCVAEAAMKGRRGSEASCPSGGRSEGKRIDSVRGDVPYQGESTEPPDPESRERLKPMTEAVDPS